MISAVFFVWHWLLFDRASTADLLVDLQQGLRQLPEAVIGLHLALCLMQFARRGKGFHDRLTFHLAGQAKVRAVSGLMATAGRLAAGATGSRDRPTAEVGLSQHLLHDGATLMSQIGERFCHGVIPP